MNIMEYRAMKAQEEQEQQQSNSQGEQPNVQAQPTTVVDTQPVVQTTTQTEPTQSENPTEGQTQTEHSPSTPEFVEIDGQPIPVEELKNGYLRQFDYTRKTQELAEAKRKSQLAEQFYQEFNKDPELAQQLAKQFNLPYVDPQTQAMVELNHKYQDLLIEKEVMGLQAKYQDFSPKEVLQFAYDRKISNLEDAYHLHKSYHANQQASKPVDVNSIKEQLRQEILAELQSNVDTTSIIQSGGDVAPVRDNTPQLTQQELKVASRMKMSPEEYAKWKNKR